MKVYINDGMEGKRKVVNVDVVKKGRNSVMVRLEDGNIVRRKRGRDFPVDGEV